MFSDREILEHYTRAKFDSFVFKQASVQGINQPNRPHTSNIANQVKVVKTYAMMI